MANEEEKPKDGMTSAVKRLLDDGIAAVQEAVANAVDAGADYDAAVAYANGKLAENFKEADPAEVAATARRCGVTSETLATMTQEYARRGRVLKPSDVQRFAAMRQEIRRT